MQIHKELFEELVWKPIASAFTGIFDYLWVKLALLVGSIPAVLSAEMFQTPELWWKGLLYLVIIDWMGGVVNAIYTNNFNWNTATKKWYHAAGYIFVCGSAAILSNTFPSVFYYFQFVVYATFFMKEFVSILKTWRMFALFEIGWHAIVKRDMSFDTFRDFRDKVDEEAEQELRDLNNE